jgi:hypothetical protein
MTKYRVRPIFDHRIDYSVYYVIQRRGPLGWFWWTVSEPTDSKERAEIDCKEAQELFEKYGD